MKYFKKFKYFLPKYILTNDDENKNKYASHKIYKLNNKYGNFLKLIICLPFILITVLWIFLTISIFVSQTKKRKKKKEQNKSVMLIYYYVYKCFFIYDIYFVNVFHFVLYYIISYYIISYHII